MNHTDTAMNEAPSKTQKHRRLRRTVLGLSIVLIAAITLGACQRGQMWQGCARASDGNPFGQDGTYILHCKSGEWVPIMTISEWLRIQAGQDVRVKPVPQRPGPAPSRPSVPSLPSGGALPPPPV